MKTSHWIVVHIDKIYFNANYEKTQWLNAQTSRGTHLNILLPLLSRIATFNTEIVHLEILFSCIYNGRWGWFLCYKEAIPTIYFTMWR